MDQLVTESGYQALPGNWYLRPDEQGASATQPQEKDY